jgi:hypothetical protein
VLAIKAYQAMDTGLIDKYLSPTMRNLGMREENIAARHFMTPTIGTTTCKSA